MVMEDARRKKQNVSCWNTFLYMVLKIKCLPFENNNESYDGALRRRKLASKLGSP